MAGAEGSEVIPPADQAERDAIRDRLDVSMLVEAAAGTGKTTSLVDRMVNLVATGRASPSRIAAITFTVKAAAQLRERFQEALEMGASPLTRPRVSGATLSPLTRGEGISISGSISSALAEIDRGFIGTTHAFCARLLRERPVEAELDPEFQELDEAAARQVTTEFWNRWYDAESAIGSPIVLEAREIGLDRRALRLNFERLIEHPDVTVISHRNERPDLARLCLQIMELIDDAAQHLPQPIDEQDKFQTLIIQLTRLRDSRDLEEDLDAQLQFLSDANHTSSVKPTQKRWPDKKVAKRIGETYEEFVTSVLRPELMRWQQYVHAVAIELLGPAVAQFAVERRRNGTLTFQDLLACARDMLRDHPAVRRYFQRRFTHLLVDEFQDTDPLQAEVMFFLTGENVEEKNWRKLTPRPGSLFIVGDPKQSIYRFRRADISTYLEVKERMEEIVELRTNFRSGPLVCTFVNEAFKTLFTADDVRERRQAAHIDLVAGGEDGPGIFGLETPHDRDNDVVAENEAARVAMWIRSAVDAGTYRYGDFLLVAWQRPRLSFYARALEQLGIAYEITGSKAFQFADALRSALPLLKTVAEPEDAVSLVAFLRGPLCGADDDALYRFVKARGRFAPFAEVPEGTDERIAGGLAMVREAVEEARKLPPAAAIARLFDRVGLLPLAVSQDRAGTRGGNLLLAMTIAREESARGEPLSSIVAQFENLLENPPDIEELDADPASADAVRLMNLHQVKGLEAPVVFLIDPAEPFEFPVEHFIDRSGEESHGHFKVSRPWGRYTRDIGFPVGWDELEQREKRFREAQSKRLLYVAATRARKMLVVGFRNTAKGVSGAWRELASRAGRPFADLTSVPSVGTSEEAVVRQFVDAQTEIASRFRISLEPSYSVLPITKLVHGDHQELVRAEEGLGKGTSWGRVIHRLFEALLRDETLNVKLYAGNLLKDEERDAAELSSVLAAVEALSASPLWRRVLAADEKYAEVPFALQVPAAGLGVDFAGETLLHGTIDLVFREGECWYIVDYKSDSTAGRLEWLVSHYTPQVEHYTRFWREMTGRETRGGLFFVDGSVERWV